MNEQRLVRALGADYSINIVELPTDPDDVRKCVAYVEVTIVDNHVLVNVRRIDEAATGPITVTLV